MSSDVGLSHLRSAVFDQLTVPRSKTSYSDQSFTVNVPVVHNNGLSAELHSHNTSLCDFRHCVTYRYVILANF